MKEILNRINQLAENAKTRKLTLEEADERKLLIKEYMQIFRGSVDSLLLNATIIDPLGNDVTPEKLKEKQKLQK